MKVCLIGATNLYGMPYMSYYRSILEECGIEYDIVYWDRIGMDEETASNIHAFKKPIKNSINKVLNLIRYKFFIEEIISKNKYDKIIIITTMPAVIVASKLVKKYRDNYIFDIRDYTFEHIKPYYKRIIKLVSYSALNVISSPEFKNFLPSAEYYTCHNISFPKDGNRNIRKNTPRNTEVIRISYIGGIGYYDKLKIFLDKIGNDQRYIMNFFGDGLDYEKIKQYSETAGLSNVKFYGRYSPKDKESFFAVTDVIYNIYGNDTAVTKYALSNKLYDAAWYYVPILVSPGTAMKHYSAGFGITVDLTEDNLSDKIISAYNGISWEAFEQYCSSFINNALEENNVLLEKLGESLISHNNR